jgi:myxalamid-type polyketide synthase MxaB
MDALMQLRRQEGRVGLSIAWGPWTLGMAAGMNDRETERIAARGFIRLTTPQALQNLGRLLGQPHAHVCVAPMHWETYFRYHHRNTIPPCFELLATAKTARPPVSEPAPPNALAQRWTRAMSGERRAVITQHVHSRVAAVLHLKPGKRIPADQGLFDYGLDSLMAVELKNQLETDLGRTLKTTLVFDYPTVDAISGYLMKLMPDAEKNRQVACQPGTSETAPVSGEEPLEALIINELTQLESLLKGESHEPIQ